MATIEIDFDVYKALTMMRDDESVTYNEVIRKLLQLETGINSKTPQAVADFPECSYKGVFFPEGTLFRVIYKGRTYRAEIKGGVWLGDDGKPRRSPSDAAHGVTGTNVNGWRFWECKRPSDADWIVMDLLRHQ